MNKYTYRDETLYYKIKAATLEFIPISEYQLPSENENILATIKIFKKHVMWNYNGNDKASFDGRIELVNMDKTEALPILNNGWKFELGYPTKCYSNDNNDRCFSANFTDTFDILNTSECFDISPQGFISAYKRFMRLSEYKGYRVATLEVENADLKEGRSELYKQISTLNSEIARLKEIISYKG